MRLSGKHFPEIPQSWRLPIVISSTTAVRQAAVMHVVCDANAGSPDPYKSALSFCALGLCALPRRAPQLHSESAPEADRETVPITIVNSATPMPENLFRSREVPVPIVASDSGFLEFYTSVSDQDASVHSWLSDEQRRFAITPPMFDVRSCSVRVPFRRA